MLKNLITKTKEKFKKTIDDTKEKVDKLADSADKFISDGNNQMKAITVIVIVAGIALTISNIVSIATNIHSVKIQKEPKVINNVYINKELIK